MGILRAPRFHCERLVKDGDVVLLLVSYNFHDVMKY